MKGKFIKSFCILLLVLTLIPSVSAEKVTELDGLNVIIEEVYTDIKIQEFNITVRQVEKGGSSRDVSISTIVDALSYSTSDAAIELYEYKNLSHTTYTFDYVESCTYPKGNGTNATDCELIPIGNTTTVSYFMDWKESKEQAFQKN